jgi:hypothetical protein
MLASLNQFGAIIFEKWSSLPGDHLLGTPATEAVNNAGVALSRLTSTLSTIALIKAKRLPDIGTPASKSGVQRA